MKEELKIKDVMVGDWVFIKDYPIKTLPQKVKPEHFVRSLVEFEPIPLTPEILEKNGFEKALQLSDTEPFDTDEEGNKHYSYNKTFWGWWQPDNIFCIPANGLGWLSIKYVHQLQHIFSLVGINKGFIL